MDRKIRKNKQSYTIYDMYHTYCKIDVDISYSRFKRILEEFNEIVRQIIIERSEGFKMPCGLGLVCIVKYKPKTYSKKSLSIDFKSSLEEGKIIYHLNLHSDGFKYRLFWSKVPKTFKARYKYDLSLTRANKRHLAQLIFDKKDYINVDDIQIYKM